MIKTLQITSIVAAIAAAAFIVLPAFSGASGNEEVRKFLNSASAIERFKQSKNRQTAADTDEVPPLVKEAQAFALYLNPPPPPPQPKPVRQRTAKAAPEPKPTLPRPEAVRAKFKLIATSYFAARPDLSLALINEPGKGEYWVRQSSEVGHLIIDQIKDGVVFLKDGERIEEIAVERKPQKSLLKTETPQLDTSMPQQLAGAVSSVTSGLSQQKPEEKITVAPSNQPGWIDPEQAVLMGEFMAALKAGASEANEADAIRNAEQSAALMQKFMSGLSATRVDNEEAGKLGDLGKQLHKSRQDPNRPQIRKKVRPPSRPQRFIKRRVPKRK